MAPWVNSTKYSKKKLCWFFLSHSKKHKRENFQTHEWNITVIPNPSKTSQENYKSISLMKIDENIINIQNKELYLMTKWDLFQVHRLIYIQKSMKLLYQQLKYHLNISDDIQKQSQKIQHPFMIKILSKGWRGITSTW